MTIEMIEQKLREFKLSEKRVQEVLAMIAELKSSSAARNMQTTKVIDGREFLYCRFHQKYEPADRFVYYKGKSKGYCKAAYAVWSRNNNRIKKLATTELAAAVANGEFSKASEIQKEIDKLKAKLNSPSSFDIVRDYHARNEKAVYLENDKIIEE